MQQRLPLQGVRALDFMQMFAGPHVSEWLSVMGAEVIKVETSLRMDQQRTRKPPNGSGGFAALNWGKMSVTLNMNQSKARELARRLVKISDIVMDNFGGQVMERWGLHYSALQEINPDVIAYSGSGYGRTGPHKDLPAYAEIISAHDGSASVNGYEGGAANIVGINAWNDGTQATHGVFAVLAALYHRSNTGDGQFIDAAMIEASANSLSELVMDYVMNGRTGERAGNRDAIMAPHGGYHCQGPDEWVAIAICTDSQWQAFCAAMGNPEWTKQAEFSDELGRWHHQDEMDRYVADWTRQYHHYEVMEMLQKAGVAAGACLTLPQILTDPQLNARGFFVPAQHPVLGDVPLAGIPWHLSNSPPGNYHHAPLLGEHNDYVLGGLLGLSEEEIARLIEEKVVC